MMEENNKIKARLRLEAYRVRRADAALQGKTVSYAESDGIIMHTVRTIEWILGKMGLVSIQMGRADNMDDLVEMFLTPLGVMYEKIDISEGKWNEFSERILAFDGAGEPVVIQNGIFLRRCYNVITEEDRRMSQRLGLKKEAYRIYQPMVADHLSLGYIIRYFLTNACIGWVLKILLLTVAVTLLGMVMPMASQLVLGKLVPQGPSALTGLIGAAVVVLVTGILQAMVSCVKSLSIKEERRVSGRTMETAVMSRVLAMPLSFFRKETSGEIAQYVSNARTTGELVVDLLFGTSVTALFSLAYIPQMVSFAPKLVIPALIMLLVQLGFSVATSVVTAEKKTEGQKIDARMNSVTYDTLKGVQKIQEAGAESRAYLKWADIYRRKMDWKFDPPILFKLKDLLVTWFPAVTTFVLITITAAGNVSGAEYLAFSSSYGLVVSAVLALSGMVDMIFTVRPLIERMAPLFEYDESAPLSTRYEKNIEGEILFDHVEFSYSGENGNSGNEVSTAAPAETSFVQKSGQQRTIRHTGFCLKEFNYKINKGQKIGIVGPSGSGKSTLVNMLIGINRPDNGTVYLDQKSLATVNFSALNRRIGFVAQYSKLLPGTLRYNIALGLDDADDEVIWEALRLACIDDYVRSLPQQLDTYVSDTGDAGFSGGQKQCLMLARAFARRSKLMILDEATSAMDELTQKKVLRNIFDMDCTLVMVAHRISAVEECDRILMFENGNVVEEGTYDALMAAGGKFAGFARLSEGR